MWEADLLIAILLWLRDTESLGQSHRAGWEGLGKGWWLRWGLDASPLWTKTIRQWQECRSAWGYINTLSAQHLWMSKFMRSIPSLRARTVSIKALSAWWDRRCKSVSGVRMWEMITWFQNWNCPVENKPFNIQLWECTKSRDKEAEAKTHLINFTTYLGYVLRC